LKHSGLVIKGSYVHADAPDMVPRSQHTAVCGRWICAMAVLLTAALIGAVVIALEEVLRRR